MDDEVRLIEEAARQWRLPAIACAVVVPGEDPRYIVRGYADVGSKTPFDAQTVVPVASITKTFTAIAVMQLRDRRLLDLDDAVNDHLLSYRVSRDDVTLRQMLTHTSGVGEQAAVSRTSHRTVAEKYGPVQQVTGPPGSAWQYSNQAFATLGQVVEDVSGLPFADYMAQHIFRPLDMRRTAFGTGHRIATGYRMRFGLTLPAVYAPTMATGAGSLTSCTEDMAAYVAALTADGAPLLDRGALNAMLTPQYPHGANPPAMGIGFWLDTVGSSLVAGHGGDLNAFKAVLRFAPGRCGVFVATNANRLPDLDLSLFAENLADRLIAVHVRTTKTQVLAEASDHGRVHGRYRAQPPHSRLDRLLGTNAVVTSRSGSLTLRSPRLGARGSVLIPTGPNAFRLTRGQLVASVAFDGDSMNIRSKAGFVTFRAQPPMLAKLRARYKRLRWTLDTHVRRGFGNRDGSRDRELAVRALITGRSGPSSGRRPDALDAPPYGKITSGFGKRYGRMHLGIDFAADPLSPVGAAHEGVVVFSGWMHDYGNTVVVNHGGGLATLYAHLSESFVLEGQPVAASETLGSVGATGRATGPHVHFEVRDEGIARDPTHYLRSIPQ